MNSLLTLFLLSFIGFTFAKVCKDIHEEFKDCGTSCPVTCADQRKYRACKMMCVSDCFCKKPYIRNQANGKCVLKDKCPPPECRDKNEAFMECGTSCPLTCDNLNETKQFCTMQCVSGCFCREPYVRDNTTKCVLRENCPHSQTCNGQNEIYNDCGNDCLRTCKNFAHPPKFCDTMCRAGCFCVDPYVRDEKTGKCVSTKDCSN